MGDILNVEGKLELFERTYKNKYFVDKTKILYILNGLIGTDQQYVCIARPRRFGKTVMTNLLSAYYAKGLDSRRIFDTLEIAKDSSYEKHLNQHNVISICMSEMPRRCKDFDSYLAYHEERILEDLKENFSECHIDMKVAVWDNLNKIYCKTGEGFIFIIDEWDSFFHSKFFDDDGGMEYLNFLRQLLKDKPYVELTYMTGVLPIRKYSDKFELNMFKEYYFPTDSKYDSYFGFTEKEVVELCNRHQQMDGKIAYEDLAEWYNGYYTYDGSRLYNPRSVCYALEENQIKNYWTETGPGNEILSLVERNVDAVKEDFLRLVAGESVYFPIRKFKTEFRDMETREEILSVMIVNGFLSYYNDYIQIPNKELMAKFEIALEDKSLGYVAELARSSTEMLQATLDGNTEKMSEILGFVHDTEIPILQYNDENSLSCVVNLIYLNARDKYRIEREDKAGKGFADFIFYPYRAGDMAIILELKVDDTPEHAIEQILEKKYDTKLRTMKEGKVVYTGPILLVGMTYDRKKKEHRCVVKICE